MAKNFYLPKKDKDKAVWLTNFANKLPSHAAALAVTAAEQTSVTNDANMFAYMIALVETFTTEKEERVNYKNILRDGPAGSPLGAMPTMPVIAAAPTAVQPGIFLRVGQLIARIKKHSGYNTDRGTDLGIIGAEQVVDTVNMKPVLKLELTGGKVNVKWNKGDTDAIRIEAIKTGTAFAFVAIDTEPDYLDNTPLPATPAVWKYRAMYLIANEPVGQWSDVVSISVGA